jgi:hypothetical protein
MKNKKEIMTHILEELQMIDLAKILNISMAVIFSLCLTGVVAVAGDLDDGISTYQDESIDEDSRLGDADVNINFIVLDAISSAKMNQDDDNVNINDGSGDSNQNSVVCEVGAECGSIINIDLD